MHLSLLSSYVCFFSSAQRRSEEILKFIESTFHFPLISHSQHKLMRESKEYAHLKSIRSGVKDGRMKISARLSGANIYSSDWKSLWLNAHFFLLQQRVEIFYRFTDCLTCNDVPTSSSSDRRMNVDSNWEFISSLWLLQFYHRGDDERKWAPSITSLEKKNIENFLLYEYWGDFFSLTFWEFLVDINEKRFFLVLPGSFSINELNFDFLQRFVSTKCQEEKRPPWIFSLLFNFHFLFIHDKSGETFSLSNENGKNAHYHTNGGCEIEEQEELWNRLRKWFHIQT